MEKGGLNFVSQKEKTRNARSMCYARGGQTCENPEPRICLPFNYFLHVREGYIYFISSSRLSQRLGGGKYRIHGHYRTNSRCDHIHVAITFIKRTSQYLDVCLDVSRLSVALFQLSNVISESI